MTSKRPLYIGFLVAPLAAPVYIFIMSSIESGGPALDSLLFGMSWGLGVAYVIMLLLGVPAVLALRAMGLLTLEWVTGSAAIVGIITSYYISAGFSSHASIFDTGIIFGGGGLAAVVGLTFSLVCRLPSSILRGMLNMLVPGYSELADNAEQPETAGEGAAESVPADKSAATAPGVGRMIRVNAVLILFAGICLLDFWYNNHTTIFFNPWLPVAWMLGLVIYGSIAAQAAGGNTAVPHIIKTHGLRYLIVLLVLQVPFHYMAYARPDLYRMSFLAMMEIVDIYGGGYYTLSSVEIITLQATIHAVVGILTLYALPFVFLQNKSLTALPSGLFFLFRHLRQSLPMIGVIIGIHVIDVYSSITMNRVIRQGGYFGDQLYYVILQMGIVFLHFTAYAMAVQALLGRKFSGDGGQDGNQSG